MIERRGIERAAAVMLLAAAIAGLAARPAAAASVYLNELKIKGVERVELYNADTAAVDVSGWSLAGQGSYILPPATSIPAGGYIVIEDPGSILPDAGGIAELIDSSGETQDAVGYGQGGSAPLPPEFGAASGGQTLAADPSLARAPDASLGAPPPPDPLTDGLVWTLDLTPTFGAMNDAPQPQPGSSLRLNELNPGLVSGPEGFELFNPAPFPVNMAGWLACNGQTFEPVNGFVPPGGFLVHATPPAFQLEALGLLYFFNAAGVRVDQLGFWNAPQLVGCDCYGQIPDGGAPPIGFDYYTSGGDARFFALRCTPGMPNQTLPACPPTSVGGHPSGWGRMRALFR